MNRIPFVFAAIMVAILGWHPVLGQNADSRMSFFLTSAGPGKGADLGGLAGADRHCQVLAAAVGQGNLTWRAYLSNNASGSQAAVNARDRIGNGPWFNSKGVQIAQNVADLHSDTNNLTKETQLSEKGDVDATCQNWTSSGTGSARVGHHDRTGGGEHPSSWNSAHGSRGCSQENLRGTGGDGLFYCFAIN